MHDPGFALNFEALDGATTVAITGELDAFSIKSVRLPSVADGGRLVVDLSGVTFIDVAALEFFIELMRHVPSVRLVSNHRVGRLLSLTGLTDFFQSTDEPRGLVPLPHPPTGTLS